MQDLVLTRVALPSLTRTSRLLPRRHSWLRGGHWVPQGEQGALSPYFSLPDSHPEVPQLHLCWTMVAGRILEWRMLSRQPQWSQGLG